MWLERDSGQQGELSSEAKRVLGMDGIIIGYLLGAALVFWAGKAYLAGEHLLTTPVTETLWVAVYLTAVVAYCGLKMPVFMAHSPYWSTWSLIMFSGHISLLFDSFAVVLLLATGITFVKLPGTNHRFNQFAVKTAAAFAALTVGGGFYLGELWGLPWYISNGMDNPLAGLPLMVVLTPYCALVAFYVAHKYPVKMNPVTMDQRQKLAAVEFTVALLLIILTHSPFLCLGIMLIYTALRRQTIALVENMAHELKSGAQNALGLITLAVVIQTAGLASIIQPYLTGMGLVIGSAISSPFAGAMAPPAVDLHGFYVGLSLIMIGAPMFVFSSLVAIVVFTETISYCDLPKWMHVPAAAFGGRKKGLVQEGIAYTLLIIPMNAGLAVLLWFGNQSGLFVRIAESLGLTLQSAVSLAH